MCLLRPAAELHYHQGEDFSPEATLGFHDAEAYGLQDTRSDDGNNDGSGDDHTDNDTNLMVEDAAIPSFLLPGGYSEPRQLPVSTCLSSLHYP